MLLKALSEFARSRPEVLADLAFEMKAIRWVIPLAKDGALAGSGLLETEGEKNRGKEFSAPQTSRSKDAGGVAEFLADGLTAVFGLDFDPEEKMSPEKRRDRDGNNARKKEDFWRQIEEAAVATDNPALFAIGTFRDAFGGGFPVFLRFGPKAGTEKSREKHKWWVTGADGTEKALGNNDAFTFQVDGVLPLLDDEQIRPYWRGIYEEEVAARAKKAPRGICLVTGREDVPIELTHLPKIKGVRGAKPSGAAIVSFDKPSFTSYGFAQSLNAPVSFDAVSAYCNGLNALLNSENHSLAIAGTAICFWAKESDAATSFLAQMLHSPKPTEVADFLLSPWAGIDRQAARLEQFYSVTLCGNAGRIAVRHWLQSTVEAACNNFKEWFQDLDMTEIPCGGQNIKPPLAID
ncbi:MAG: type I-C CRISPR-associated protein Cas8c/Csd1 [Desulfobacteraceae bacterium]|nr:type I-C CRISPR-associated protein Cas8c/Csd1 [Desulfobacteraceae bacterium]